MSPAPYRLAIIDDEPPVIDLLATIVPIDGRLELAGTYEAASLALNDLANIHPDAVLCDVHMPGIDGLTALPELRKVCANAVIAMYTADPDAAATAMTRGADSVIDKAIQAEELIDHIIALIQDKRTALPAG